MHLSWLSLNYRNHKARRDLGDAYEQHRTLLSAFPDQSQGGPGRVLYRPEIDRETEESCLLVQSEKVPDWSKLPENYLVRQPLSKTVRIALRPDQRLCFRLRANPTVKRAGKRHPLGDEEAHRSWLLRKGEQHGFYPLFMRISPEGRSLGYKSDFRLTHDAVRFDGGLKVADPTRLLEAITAGIGSAKAFGFGLLSLAPWED